MYPGHSLSLIESFSRAYVVKVNLATYVRPHSEARDRIQVPTDLFNVENSSSDPLVVGVSGCMGSRTGPRIREISSPCCSFPESAVSASRIFLNPVISQEP